MGGLYPVAGLAVHVAWGLSLPLGSSDFPHLVLLRIYAADLFTCLCPVRSILRETWLVHELVFVALYTFRAIGPLFEKRSQLVIICQKAYKRESELEKPFCSAWNSHRRRRVLCCVHWFRGGRYNCWCGPEPIVSPYNDRLDWGVRRSGGVYADSCPDQNRFESRQGLPYVVATADRHG